MKGIYSPFTRLVECHLSVSRLHRVLLERQLNKTGVYRSQHQLLMYIANNPNASQKEIARRHRVSTATVAVSLKKLEQGGYIIRAVDQSDNRCNQICITEKGRKVVEQSFGYFEKLERQMFEGFSEEDLEGYQKYQERILYNLCSLLPESERKCWDSGLRGWEKEPECPGAEQKCSEQTCPEGSPLCRTRMAPQALDQNENRKEGNRE